MQEASNTSAFTLPQIDLSKLTDLKYLLEPQPASFAFSGILILVLVLLLVISVLAKFLLRRGYLSIIGPRKVVLNKASTFNFILALVGLVLAFLRLQGVLYVSMRLVLLIYVLGLTGMNLFFLYKYFTSSKIGVVVEKKAKGIENYQDYLPRKNKKRKK